MRLKLYEFYIPNLKDLFIVNNIHTVTAGMPRDAKIIHTHIDVEKLILMLTVESESFEDVKAGNLIPLGKIIMSGEKL